MRRERIIRKPLPSSTLKTLPYGVQDKIYNHLYSHSCRETVGWCAQELQVKTSASALNEFYSWYPLYRPLTAAKEQADQVKGILKEMPELNLNDETLSLAAQRVFEEEALRRSNFGQYESLRYQKQNDRKLGLKEQELKLAREKFEFDAAAAALKCLPSLKSISDNRSMTSAQKLQQARLALFGVAPS